MPDIVLFDDVCVLCNSTVSHLLKIDKKRKLKFASLQGELGQNLRASGKIKSSESVVFWNGQTVFEKSEAVIQILQTLGGTYKFAARVLKIFPIFILNFAYDLIAKNRYKIFGKNKTCRIPTSEEKKDSAITQSILSSHKCEAKASP